MMNSDLMQTTELNDAALVAESLDGSRDAFRRIVERYQTLICSLAYCATGNVSQSEDMAQETFLAAWKDLRLLREPHKLRPWLCGIVRCRIQKSLRREEREPAHNAATLEEAQDAPACEALPSEQTISREEEVILWRSLEKIPNLYREPLILFYRQHQSIEQVAEALELSEDAVKQRLSRGRKLLQEEVRTFVEGALRRTAPGRAFSGAVLAAIPMAAGPAATAGLGVGAKGTAAAKSGLLAAWLGPFFGFLAGFAAQWMVIHVTAPERERRAKLLKLIVTWICLLGFPGAGEMSVHFLGQHFEWSARTRFASEAGFWGFWCVVLATWLILAFRQQSAIISRREEAVETSRQAVKALTPAQSVFLAVGSYLTMFSWLIYLTWREHDRITAAVIIGVVLVMGGWHFLHGGWHSLPHRGTMGVAAWRAANRHMALCCAVVVAVINLRIDVWAAAAYGVSVAEVHSLPPFWIVPLFTLALVAWIGAFLALTKPKSL
jgi:RNA polymerase sigma factor (sigma-70 family)